jgi:glyoxylase-like metal-dependent hydrolase (beta-lactamase superfamily II)
VTAIPVGGHSPGQQVFVVQTGAGPVVLASDAVHLYDEWEAERPFGVIADLVAMYEAYGLLRELQRDLGATVVPGHDPKVAERFDQVSGAPPGLAYAIA